MDRFATASMLVALLATGTAAASPCAIGAWSIATAPEGVPVRSGPSAGAPVIGRLPPVVAYEGGLQSGRGPEFQILEADKGWFRIGSVSVPKVEDDDVVDMVPLAAEGWIAGDAIYFMIQSRKGFAEPDNTSAIAFTVDDWNGPRDWLYLSDCRDKWVQIAYGTPKQEKRAWFRGICASQETSCDGVQGDE